MDNSLDTITLVAVGCVIYLVCYVLAFFICRKAKYSLNKKKDLIGLMTNAICFIFFLVYGQLDNHNYIHITILQGLWFILFPISLLFILIFTVSFLAKRDKKERAS